MVMLASSGLVVVSWVLRGTQAGVPELETNERPKHLPTRRRSVETTELHSGHGQAGPTSGLARVQGGEDHDRVKSATRGEGATTEVEPVLPADVIGLYVLFPEAN